MQTKLVRGLFLILGFLSLSLGLLGVFLPILPTTPFLLLTAWLFFRGSPKTHQWFINKSIAGKYTQSFIEHKAIPLKAKITSITILWVTITLSALYFISYCWIKMSLFAIAIGVSAYILSYKTLQKNQKQPVLKDGCIE